MTTELYRIDVHHHILPPIYVDALKSIGADRSGGSELPAWTKEDALAMMDRQGIATAITSISSPGVYFGDIAFARDLARRCNEYSADLVRDNPHRFGALALLPLPDADAALEEIAYALDTLHLDGVILQASVGDQYLGDPAFDPVFDELNRRKVTVLLHPTTPPGSDVPKLDLPAFLVEFIFDTTRAVANLIVSGTLERCPDIAMIISHAGGAAPYLAGRFDTGEHLMPKLKERAPKGALSYLECLYYDTALSTTPYVLHCLQEFVSPIQIVFGTDYPYQPEKEVRATIDGLRRYDGFDTSTRHAIQRGNILPLFPRLQARNPSLMIGRP